MQYSPAMNATRRPRSIADRIAAIAWTSLLVLGLGAAGHLWHHLTDADCESPARGGHACSACAGFHGGALTGHSEAAAAPAPSTPSRFLLPATDCAIAYASPVGPTRGPPQG
jgi:hypothetical protein